MKRRTTYITAPDAPFDPTQQAILSKDALSIRGLDAAKEERFTFSSTELPAELIESLHATRTLHIRWSSERNYDPVAPFLGRTSPGLHVYHTPSDNGALGESTDRICPLIKSLFGNHLKCTSQEASFSEPPILAETFSSEPSLQFHHVLPSIEHFVEYIRNKVCGLNDVKCADHILSLSLADFVAIDYDATAQTTILSAFWSEPPAGTAGWTEDITKQFGSAEKVEVGLLSNEEAIDVEDISLGGFLAVVGQDSKLKPTLFSFPSRHHTLPGDATYTTAFETPTGLHPTLKISLAPSALARPPAPEDTVCALHTYLTLPSTIFADKYQLSTQDHLFLNSHNLRGLRAVSGETDLEAPDWVLPRWGSNLLIELATPSEDQAIDSSSSWDITIPLHLRYLKPSESGLESASLPWPLVFWACSAELGTEMGKNPFDRVNLGYDTLFPPRTFLFHLHPESPSEWTLIEEIRVPVLQAATDGERPYGEAAARVELGTVVAISIGFIWVLWKLICAFTARSPPRSTSEANKKET